MFKEFKKVTERNAKEKMIEIVLNCFNRSDMMTLLNEWMMKQNVNSLDGHLETAYERLDVTISRKPKSMREELDWYFTK